MGTIVYGIHEFPFRITVMCRFSSICTVQLHWLILLLFECLRMCNWRGDKTDGMRVSVLFSLLTVSFYIFFALFTFKEIVVYFEKNVYFVESSSFYLHFLKRRSIGKLFRKTFSFNFGKGYSC